MLPSVESVSPVAEPVVRTALCDLDFVQASAIPLEPWDGALTPRAYTLDADAPRTELRTLLKSAAFFDLGYRTRIRVSGEDRLRWLNGMVTNAIANLTENHGTYNYILNAQGRILGDAYVYRLAEELLIDTDRLQASRLSAHLEHFIIMDDVELTRLDPVTTGIGIAGPEAGAVLDSLGWDASALEPLQLADVSLHGVPATLIRAYSVSVPRFELWCEPAGFGPLQAELAEKAQPAGFAAVEMLRVLEGIPKYGVDFTDRHLPQETRQDRALNFNKGCYLGQEIVERIRSRATVHRNLRQFELSGALPALPAALHIAGSAEACGQLTSAATTEISGSDRTFAIGFVRTEAVQRAGSLEYPGGIAVVLDQPPLPGASSLS